MKEGKLPKRLYTEEFKVEAVRLAGSVGGHEAARRLGVGQLVQEGHYSDRIQGIGGLR